jgi:hypothetical protein
MLLDNINNKKPEFEELVIFELINRNLYCTNPLIDWTKF